MLLEFCSELSLWPPDSFSVLILIGCVPDVSSSAATVFSFLSKSILEMVTFCAEFIKKFI